MMKVEPIKEDAEFPNVALPVNEYYPALGEKVIAVRAKLASATATYGTTDDFLNGFDITKWGLKLVSTDPAAGVIVKRLSTDGKCLAAVSPGDYLQDSFTPVGLLSDGSARFCIAMDNQQKDLPGNFSIKLRAQRRDTIFANKNTATDPQTFAFVVKHNGNVTLESVLAGNAVFVYDPNAPAARQGAYRENEANGQKRFHFVQELLNQVMTRKRSVQMYTVMSANSEPQFAAPATNKATNNPLLEEDGVYNDLTAAKILSFRRTFKMDYEGSRIGNTRVSYANGQYALTDNTSDIFRKLMKDYGAAAQANGQTGARYRDGQADESAKWLGRIVDKATLVGRTERRVKENDKVNMDDHDVLINDPVNEYVRNDTGLYELYSNAVAPFVTRMIDEGNAYMNSTGSGLNTTWSSRPDSQGASVINDKSVSYCFGCKNTYTYFWSNVTGCQPPVKGKADPLYRGGVNDLLNCQATGGDKRYPGLYEVERSTATQYMDKYWIGLDCAGFVQRVSTAAKDLNIPGVQCKIKDLDDSRLPVITNRYFSAEFGQAGGTNLVYYWENPRALAARGKQQSKLRKGDLVNYPGHVSMVYTDKPRSCTRSGCIYEIIHAYGGNKLEEYEYPQYDKILPSEKVFARKVIRTWQKIYVKNTDGFSRIKIWE